nr:uncharacterized protein LOC127489199 [Oryctolagus cuniculus]
MRKHENGMKFPSLGRSVFHPRTAPHTSLSSAVADAVSSGCCWDAPSWSTEPESPGVQRLQAESAEPSWRSGQGQTTGGQRGPGRTLGLPGSEENGAIGLACMLMPHSRAHGKSATWRVQPQDSRNCSSVLPSSVWSTRAAVLPGQRKGKGRQAGLSRERGTTDWPCEQAPGRQPARPRLDPRSPRAEDGENRKGLGGRRILPGGQRSSAPDAERVSVRNHECGAGISPVAAWLPGTPVSSSEYLVQVPAPPLQSQLPEATGDGSSTQVPAHLCGRLRVSSGLLTSVWSGPGCCFTLCLCVPFKFQ